MMNDVEKETSRFSKELARAEHKAAQLAAKLNMDEELRRRDLSYDDWIIDQISMAEHCCAARSDDEPASKAAEVRLIALLRLERSRGRVRILRHLRSMHEHRIMLHYLGPTPNQLALQTTK